MGPADTGLPADLGLQDTGETDAGMDGGVDGGAPDLGLLDLGPADLGELDTGPSLDAGPTNPDSGLIIPPGAEWTWSPMQTSQPRAMGATAWTGTEMMITGGRGGGSSACSANTLFYNPALDSWRTIADNFSFSSASAGVGDDAVLISGGYNCGLVGLEARDRAMLFMPRWDQVISDQAPIPGARILHSTIWTGQEFILWGGSEGPDICTVPCVDGANLGLRYDMANDSWIPLSTMGAPPGGYAVWADGVMVIWGQGQGGRYDPSTDSWMPIIPSAVAPEGSLRGMTWTGAQLFVYGSAGSALYDPISDTWTAVSQIGAPSLSYSWTFWTGAEVLVIGPEGGGHYDPVADAWRAIPLEGAALPGPSNYAVWTGLELLVYQSGSAAVQATGSTVLG